MIQTIQFYQLHLWNTVHIRQVLYIEIWNIIICLKIINSKCHKLFLLFTYIQIVPKRKVMEVFQPLFHPQYLHSSSLWEKGIQWSLHSFIHNEFVFKIWFQLKFTCKEKNRSFISRTYKKINPHCLWSISDSHWKSRSKAARVILMSLSCSLVWCISYRHHYYQVADRLWCITWPHY